MNGICGHVKYQVKVKVAKMCAGSTAILTTAFAYIDAPFHLLRELQLIFFSMFRIAINFRWYNISYLRHGIFETIPVESMIDCVRSVLIMLWDKKVGVCDLIRMSFGFPYNSHVG